MKNTISFSFGAISLLSFSLNCFAQQKPNIVIYLADDQGQNDCSVYGAKVLQTPTAEMLANAGLTFNNAFVASPAAIIQKYFIRPNEEFYDIQNDPFEQLNLIDSKIHQKQIRKMRLLLDNWMLRQGDAKSVFETPYPVSGPKPHELGIK